MVFITAEIGINWIGDLDLAEQLMVGAKKAGCNAVKFQAFNEKIVNDHPAKDLLLRSTISEKNIEQINNISKKVGIEWYCTPMYPEAIEFLDPYVNRYKIRYSDSQSLFLNKQTPLITNILKTGKQVIISSEKNPKETELYNNPNVKWLYVVPKYPCTLEDLDFLHLDDFDGYSNHCRHFLAPLTAVILGAEMIEIHITHDHNGDYLDNPVSFDLNELQTLVELIHLSQKIKHVKNLNKRTELSRI